MRTLLLLLYIWIPLADARDLKSPYPSSVPGIEIPNTHLVEPNILRGMLPRTEAEILQLRDHGVKQVLIFRTDSEGESGADEEIEMIERVVGSDLKVDHIPFPWKEMKDFETPCRQVIEGLRFLREAQRKKETIYFHCTVGEDRTGLLAGLYRHIFTPSHSQSAIFRNEMCARGYARGNPQKPDDVVELVHNNVTDLYVKMLHLIQTKQLTTNLEEHVCARDPRNDKSFRAMYKSLMERHRCSVVEPEPT